MNRKGKFSHPTACTTTRKIISTGRVTSRRVIITSLGEGCREFLDCEIDSAAACRAVDSRDTKIEPTLPGRLLMATASIAKPSYLWTKRSRTMPVATSITIAPNSGDHPSSNKCRTRGFRRVNVAHVMALRMTTKPTTEGIGVLIIGMSRVDTKPMKLRVMRSPKQEAIGGAILSGSRP